MAGKVKFKRSSAGVREMLRSAEAQAAVTELAQTISGRAGPYHVHGHQTEKRASAYVSPDGTSEGYRAARKHALERAVGSIG